MRAYKHNQGFLVDKLYIQHN